jgi:hypothetical protein
VLADVGDGELEQACGTRWEGRDGWGVRHLPCEQATDGVCVGEVVRGRVGPSAKLREPASDGAWDPARRTGDLCSPQISLRRLRVLHEHLHGRFREEAARETGLEVSPSARRSVVSGELVEHEPLCMHRRERRERPGIGVGEHQAVVEGFDDDRAHLIDQHGRVVPERREQPIVVQSRSDRRDSHPACVSTLEGEHVVDEAEHHVGEAVGGGDRSLEAAEERGVDGAGAAVSLDLGRSDQCVAVPEVMAERTLAHPGPLAYGLKGHLTDREPVEEIRGRFDRGSDRVASTVLRWDRGRLGGRGMEPVSAAHRATASCVARRRRRRHRSVGPVSRPRSR